MNQEVRHDIVRRRREGQSLRGIAEDLQLARKTVKRVIEAHQRQREEGIVSPALTPRKKRSSQLDEHEAAIRELLDRYPDITVTRLWQELRAKGYQGGYTVLRKRVLELRPRKSSPFVERFETGPGQQAQMDYSVYDLDFTHEGRRRVNLFSYILGYSRRHYLRFVESQDVVYRTVDHEGYISSGQNRYSVPWDKTHPGQVLPVKITEAEVIIYSLHLCELTRHARLHRSVTHQTRQHPEHRPPRDVESRRELARQQFQELGETAVAFLDGLLRTQRRGWEQARQILACLRNYRREDLRAALERAHRFGAFSLGAVERILAVQAHPKTSCEHLADQAQDHLRELLGDDPTPPRDAAEYQRLLFNDGEPKTEPTPTEEPDDESTQKDDPPVE